MKKTTLLIVGVVLAALIAGGIYWYFASPSSAKAGPPGGFAVPVEAAKVQTETLTNDITAVGTLRANQSVVLRPETAGRLASIHFRDGQKVTKGQALFTFDQSVPSAELAQSRAQLTLSESNYKRAVELEKKKFISESARDQALSTYEAARANTAMQAAKLGKLTIQAPFSGTVGIRQVNVGDYLKDGQDMVNIEDLSVLKVDFRVPENQVATLKPGQSLELTTDAFPDDKFSATVEAIDPSVDAAGRTILLRAKVDDTAGKLHPGMFARVRLTLSENKGALTIPEESLMPVGSDQFVFRIVDGKVQRQKVKPGIRIAGKVEILEGLKAEDMVVTAGQLKLRDGAPVRTGPPPGAPPAAGAGGAPAAPAKQ